MRKTRTVMVGGCPVGGGAPVRVQSMTNTPTADIRRTVAQIEQLEAAGCELVRLAVPDLDSAEALAAIKEEVGVPVIADVHFRPSIALASLEAGADKLRLNPGTISDPGRLKEIVGEALDRKVPIRIGVNSGSLHPKYREAPSGPAAALVDSALEYAELFESVGFRDIVVSVKSSSVVETVEAYRVLAAKCDYPLHVGVTEAGPLLTGAVKSAVGLGILLAEGIGETIRVSLTADPVEEVRVAYGILRSLELRGTGPELISCPTCGRSTIDLVPVAEKIEKTLAELGKPMRVAVMGCEVNGPGEARHADVGVAWGRERGLLFKKGKVVRKVELDDLIPALLEEVSRWSGTRNGRDESG